MGLTLIWGVMDVVNLTHGAMIVCRHVRALCCLTNALGISPYVAIVPVLLGGFAVGVGLYWVAVHRVIGRAALMSLLSTFSVNLVVVGLGTAVLGHRTLQCRGVHPRVQPRPLYFSRSAYRCRVMAAVIAYALYLFLRRTRIGKAVRAVANNREAAELVGIPTTRVLAFTFGTRRGARRGRRRADRHAVSLHRAVGRRLHAQELRGDRSRRLRQSARRAICRRRAGRARRRRHSLRAGELDAGDRVRAVRGGADRLSRRACLHRDAELCDAAPASGTPAVLLDHRAHCRGFCRSLR